MPNNALWLKCGPFESREDDFCYLLGDDFYQTAQVDENFIGTYLVKNTHTVKGNIVLVNNCMGAIPEGFSRTVDVKHIVELIMFRKREAEE